MEAPSNTARELFKLLRGVGFTITADDKDSVCVSAPDEAMLPLLHTRYAGLVAKYSTEMRQHMDALDRLADRARLAAMLGDTETAWNLWTAVRGMDPEHDEAMKFATGFFSRADARQSVAANNKSEVLA